MYLRVEYPDGATVDHPITLTEPTTIHLPEGCRLIGLIHDCDHDYERANNAD